MSRPAVPGDVVAAALRAEHARRLFDGIASAYAWPAELFSFGQYGRWRRVAVKRLDVRRGGLVLDVATGTGLVARDVMGRTGARVIGLDQSPGMLAQAGRLGIPLVAASATALPFGDATFDGLTFTYLLRYVEDPAAVLGELVRVLKRGAPMASVEFGRPPGRITGPLWSAYALVAFPLGTRAVSRGWAEVGEFLGASIASFNRRWPPERLAALWREAGMIGIDVRRMSFGGGVVTWGRKA